MRPDMPFGDTWPYCEAISGSGDIHLAAEIEREGLNGRGALVLSVRDSGRGITEEFIRTSLFRPFTTTKPGGLGVGLAQCKGIVEAHGGGISVESEPGRGTTFWVRIPVSIPPVSAAEAPQAPAVVRGSGSVGVDDPEPAGRVVGEISR